MEPSYSEQKIGCRFHAAKVRKIGFWCILTDKTLRNGRLYRAMHTCYSKSWFSLHIYFIFILIGILRHSQEYFPYTTAASIMVRSKRAAPGGIHWLSAGCWCFIQNFGIYKENHCGNFPLSANISGMSAYVSKLLCDVSCFQPYFLEYFGEWKK